MTELARSAPIAVGAAASSRHRLSGAPAAKPVGSVVAGVRAGRAANPDHLPVPRKSPKNAARPIPVGRLRRAPRPVRPDGVDRQAAEDRGPRGRDRDRPDRRLEADAELARPARAEPKSEPEQGSLDPVEPTQTTSNPAEEPTQKTPTVPPPARPPRPRRRRALRGRLAWRGQPLPPLPGRRSRPVPSRGRCSRSRSTVPRPGRAPGRRQSPRSRSGRSASPFRRRRLPSRPIPPPRQPTSIRPPRRSERKSPRRPRTPWSRQTRIRPPHRPPCRRRPSSGGRTGPGPIDRRASDGGGARPPPRAPADGQAARARAAPAGLYRRKTLVYRAGHDQCVRETRCKFRP